MKKLNLVITLACLCVAPALDAQNVPTIYGSMIDNSSWSNWDRYEGVYSFQPTTDADITPVFTNDYDLAATAGGVLVDDVYHIFKDRGGSSMFSVAYTSYHIADWSVEYSCYFSSVIVSNDMTCDPTTDKVYCVQKKGKQGKLAVWDPQNIDDINEVSTLDTEILAIAADADGELYGVGSDGGFYKIGKTDGSLTLIGDTGVKPKGQQGAVFDYATGTLYWTAYTTKGKSSLYTIDTATGEATKIKDFVNNARFCGLYMLSTTTVQNAPAAVDDLSIVFENGKNDGSVKFTLPTKTFGGSDLTGTLQYRLEADETVIAEGTGAVGEKVELSLNMASGQHQFVLVTLNDAGESPKTKCSVYVGKGKPGYVDYATAQAIEMPNHIQISWKAPEYCIPLDAYFDPKELTYTVVRIPDNKVIAEHITDCSVIDNIEYNGPLTIFKYEITAYNGDMPGNAASTNGVAVGDALLPPYEASMTSADLDFFTIIDANHDDMTWGKDFYGYGVSCGGRWDGDCDDWLILPPLHLENNGLYHTMITVGNDYDGPSRWELKIGKSPTAEAMTQTIMAPTSTVNSCDQEIKVSEAGTYYIGIHCIGSAGTTMFVSDIIIRNAANNDAPDAPINVYGVGAEKGELAAYVTFTTPSMTIGGDRLDALQSVNIYHGEKLVYTLEGVEPDTEYTCKVEADQEFNEYSVAAVNEYGEGRRTRIEYVFAGYDFPAIATNVQLTETDNRLPKLTWDSASEVGLYGYYVNPDDVTYEIYRGYGDDTYDLVAEGYKGTEFIDENLDLERDQFMLIYYIYPVNSIGRSYGSSSNSICVGTPYDAPFVENFPNGQSCYTPWYYRTNNPQNVGWTMCKNTDTTIEDIDGSNGMMAFSAMTSGDEATLYAPYVSVQDLSNPVLEFCYYEGAFLKAPVVKVNGSVCINRAQLNEAETGWQRYETSLSDYADTDRIQIEFIGKSDNGETYSFIDKVRVRQLYQQDLAVSRLIVPETMSLDEETTVKVIIDNDGAEASKGAILTLYRNGYAVDKAEISAIEAGNSECISFVQTVDVSFGETPVYVAELSYELDEDLDNNTSAEVASSIKIPRYPAPDGVKADVQDNVVNLAWTRPTATSMAPDPIVEDFESYESFTTTFSPWTLVDGDKQKTVIMSDPMSWYEYLDYPHCGEAMAYQIFSPTEVGIDTETWWTYAPHSGDKVAICWSTDDWAVANDDWMISPELYPGGQTISFYVYSRTGYFDNEKYEVLYSSTNTNVKSFKLLTNGIATDEWTKISVTLPEDAKYFAIHTVSSQSNTEVWYDDITYLPATLASIPLDLVGFNIYRDNVRINESPVKETSYTDTEASTGKHKYNVSAVYEVGESALSEDVMADVNAGIRDALSADVTVMSGKGYIRIIGADGKNVNINSVNGILITQTKAASPDQVYQAQQGIYVVSVDGNAYKVIVR